jgi:hypothetical protein
MSFSEGRLPLNGRKSNRRFMDIIAPLVFPTSPRAFCAKTCAGSSARPMAAPVRRSGRAWQFSDAMSRIRLRGTIENGLDLGRHPLEVQRSSA